MLLTRDTVSHLQGRWFKTHSSTENSCVFLLQRMFALALWRSYNTKRMLSVTQMAGLRKFSGSFLSCIFQAGLLSWAAAKRKQKYNSDSIIQARVQSWGHWAQRQTDTMHNTISKTVLIGDSWHALTSKFGSLYLSYFWMISWNVVFSELKLRDRDSLIVYNGLSCTS